MRPTSRPKCLVMHLNGLDWFCGYPSMVWITCFGGNSSISIFGSGSKWLFVVLQLFWKGGMKNFFSSGPQLCMLKNIHETYHWKAL